MGEDRQTFMRMMDFLEPRTIAGSTTLSKVEFYGLATEESIVFLDRSFILKADRNMHMIELPVYPALIRGFDIDNENRGFAALDYCPPDKAYDLLCLRHPATRCLNESHVTSEWNRLRSR